MSGWTQAQTRAYELCLEYEKGDVTQKQAVIDMLRTEPQEVLEVFLSEL